MRTIQMNAVDDEGYAIDKVGIFKELGGEKILYESHDYGLSRSTRVRVVAPKGFTEDEVYNALYDHYYYSCHHEHDCCGCVMSNLADFKPAGKKREYFITINETQNV